MALLYEVKVPNPKYTQGQVHKMADVIISQFRANGNADYLTIDDVNLIEELSGAAQFAMYSGKLVIKQQNVSKFNKEGLEDLKRELVEMTILASNEYKRNKDQYPLITEYYKNSKQAQKNVENLISEVNSL